MDSFTNHYYKLNRLLFLIIGQWPYQDYRMKFGLMIIIFLYFGLALLGQIFKLIRAGHDLDLIFEILITLLSNVICITRYCNCIVNVNKFRKLLENIKDVWNATKMKEEIEIIKIYAEEVFSYFSLGFVDLISLMPCILDVVLPLNDTRTRKFSYQAEFFLDVEIYFYPILLHTWITMFFGVTILITTESIFLMFAQHCCSMFKILCYRLEHIYDKNLENTNRDNAYYEAKYRVADCIKYHTKILEFITTVISYHELSFFIQFLIIVILTSIVFVQIKILLGKYEVLIYLALIGSLVCHGYLCVYPGQKVLDHSNLLLEKAYNGFWYLAPTKAQKLLLIIIRRSINSTPLIIMKLYVLSHYSFGLVFKTSMSYFTVLYSFR
ncbi:uncharacterized protein LOC124950208 isoform X2 [Vespa velutina]|uniref:uncharacterized protein LOC124950208 isoform X2 n=1 Tax=Vespa velutina TaxID=202808 RepID=UPI001FB2FD3B|nr:uncharacterized protein LOC124950208 isoform X2 [Vespa velutina]